jgi:hypothetical protein
MSPVRQAQKIRDPVLFLCAGEGGSKKPSEQTGRMLRALPPGKMDVDLITYDSNLNGSEILRRNLEAALAFFHKHDPGTRPNPNPGEPAPSR